MGLSALPTRSSKHMLLSENRAVQRSHPLLCWQAHGLSVLGGREVLTDPFCAILFIRRRGRHAAPAEAVLFHQGDHLGHLDVRPHDLQTRSSVRTAQSRLMADS
jgi:hypothetical protein